MAWEVVWRKVWFSYFPGSEFRILNAPGYFGGWVGVASGYLCVVFMWSYVCRICESYVGYFVGGVWSLCERLFEAPWGRLAGFARSAPSCRPFAGFDNFLIILYKEIIHINLS
jgi:hypothetical protein